MTTTTTPLTTCPPWCAVTEHDIEHEVPTGAHIVDHVSAAGAVVGADGSAWLVRSDVIDVAAGVTQREPRVWTTVHASERGMTPTEARTLAAELLALADAAEAGTLPDVEA